MSESHEAYVEKKLDEIAEAVAIVPSEASVSRREQLRDYWAGQALQGLMVTGFVGVDVTPTERAIAAFQHAEAMLVEYDKKDKLI